MGSTESDQPIEFHLDWVAAEPELEMELIATDHGFDARVLQRSGPGGDAPVVAIGLGDPRESEAYREGGLHQQIRLIGLLMSHGYEAEDIMLAAANERSQRAAYAVFSECLSRAEDLKEGD